MNTEIKVIAGLLASVIWADGEYDAAEKVAVEEIADALDFDLAEFQQAVEAELSVVHDKTDASLNLYLQENASKVNDNEIGIVYQAAIQLAVSDGVLGIEEVEVLHAIADVLGISLSMATMMIADLVKTEPDLEISFEL